MHKLIIAVVTTLSLIALPAHADRGYDRGGYRGHADRGHDHGGHRGHGHRGGNNDGAVWAGLAVFGALAGLAILAERSAPVQAAPVYMEPYTEPVYAAPPAYAAPPPAATENWYYCNSSAMYYPDTNACPEGWQTLPARPY